MMEYIRKKMNLKEREKQPLLSRSSSKPSESPPLQQQQQPSPSKIRKRKKTISVTIEHEVRLRRHITRLQAISIIAGTVIGSGIFISPTGVVKYSCGSVGASLCIWLATGFYCLAQALCYSELAAVIPKAGGDYAYLYDVLGSLPAFLAAWLELLINCPSSLAVLARASALYLTRALRWLDCNDDVSLITWTAIWLLVFIALVNAHNLMWSTRLQNIFFGSKLLALFVILIVGVYRLCGGGGGGGLKNFYSPFKSTTGKMEVTGLAMAALNGYFAFKGWELVCTLPEEMVNPTSDLPIAISVSMTVVTLIYVLINFAYFTVLTPAQLIRSDAVAQEFAALTLPAFIVWLVPIFVALSCLGSLNGTLLSSARFLFAVGRNKQLPETIGFVHYEKRTPIPSIILIAILATIYTMYPNVEELLQYASMSLQLKLILVMIAFFYLRWRKPKLYRPFKVNILLAIFVFFGLLSLVGLTIYESPLVIGACCLLFVLGIPFYYIGEKLKNNLLINKFNDKFTILFQKITETIPVPPLPGANRTVLYSECRTSFFEASLSSSQ